MRGWKRIRENSGGLRIHIDPADSGEFTQFAPDENKEERKEKKRGKKRESQGERGTQGKGFSLSWKRWETA